MAGNSIGELFGLTTFGESHGVAIGGIIDGCPPGIIIDYELIREELMKRQTGHSLWTSARKEPNEVEFISGTFDGKSTGTPIAFLIRNKDAQSADYDRLKDIFRPSHADYTYFKKYGIRDHRGGGRASARETVARVVAGAVAKMILRKKDITITGFVSNIGGISCDCLPERVSQKEVDSSPVKCPDRCASEKIMDLLEKISSENDSVGGIITCIVRNVPAGLGEPVFDKLNADLAKAVMSINAAKGIEFGAGFDSASMRGSDYNDRFFRDKGIVRTVTNNAGGIQGGISNGMEIVFNVAFKPASSIGIEQKTLTSNGKEIKFTNQGRHDVCFVPRAVPVVEAMTAITLVDHFLQWSGIESFTKCQ